MPDLKKRVMLSLSEKDAVELDRVKDKLGLDTRVGLIKQALAMIEVVDDKMKEGYTLQFKKGNKFIEVIWR